MRRLKYIIAFGLMVYGVILVMAIVYETEAGFRFSGLNYFFEELTTPRIAYSKFLELVANKETAKKNIESIDWVDTNYAGKFFDVKLRNDSNHYRVRIPKVCKEHPGTRLESYGISVGFYWSCL